MIPALYTAASRSLFRFIPGIAWRVDTPDRRLYLTFDDGPFGDTTPGLLGELDRLGIRATFFVIGKHAVAVPEVVREMSNRGHSIGNHGYDHLDAWRVDSCAALDDLEKGDQALTEILNRPPVLVRPPHGHLRPATVRWTRDRNKRFVLWDTPSRDFEEHRRRSARASNLFMSPAKGSIIVLHERPGASDPWMQAFTRRCEQLKAAGWAFAAL